MKRSTVKKKLIEINEELLEITIQIAQRSCHLDTESITIINLQNTRRRELDRRIYDTVEDIYQKRKRKQRKLKRKLIRHYKQIHKNEL